MQDGTTSRFRRRRGRILAARLRSLATELGRDLRVLDVGGRRDYWDNVGFDGIAAITILNNEESDLGRETARSEFFVDRVGDARDLSDLGDGSVDFYHSNSVIEHVGSWDDMAAMASEAARVAPHGWVQTPAWEFPVEPHFRLPFMHWLARPARASLLRFAPAYRGRSLHERRRHAERINLLSRHEVRALFPGTTVRTERVIFAKSYVAEW